MDNFDNINHACLNGDYDTVEELLPLIDDINQVGEHGYTILHNAVLGGNQDIVELICGVDDVQLNIRDEHGSTPIVYAIRDLNQEVFDILSGQDGIDLNTVDNDGRTLLHHACWAANIDVVEYLLENTDLDVFVEDNNQKTPLFDACEAHDNDDVIRRLLDNIEDDDERTFYVNKKDADGRTAMFFAAGIQDNLSTIRLLVERYHAQVNITDVDGVDLIDFAEPNQQNHDYLAQYIDNINSDTDETNAMQIDEPNVNQQHAGNIDIDMSKNFADIFLLVGLIILNLCAYGMLKEANGFVMIRILLLTVAINIVVGVFLLYKFC